MSDSALRQDHAQLAARIAAVTAAHPGWLPGSMKRPWYMLNIQNPVVDKLLRRYQQQNGISTQYPMSDTERLQFELELLHPGTVREIAAAISEMERKYLQNQTADAP